MQPVPEGYQALDFVGFTDRGIWSVTETYIKNDIVHKDNIVWRCLIDDTIGIMPAEGESWTLFVDGAAPFYGAYDTFPIPGDPGRFYIDDTVDPRLMYTWDSTDNKYILTGGAGGSDGGSIDIPITLTVADWTGTSAPYFQTVTVPQMREGMTPLFYLSSAGADAEYAYSLITGYTTSYAEITFRAADLPTVDLSLTLKGVPAQELDYVDNTIVVIVEPSAFAVSTDPAYDGRYVATIPVEGMQAGTGGVWDIVRSGPVLTEAESKIALSITDVERLDGAVRIVSLEAPGHRFLMSIQGTYAGAGEGDIILAGMTEWFDRVEALENMFATVELTVDDVFSEEKRRIRIQSFEGKKTKGLLSVMISFEYLGGEDQIIFTLNEGYRPHTYSVFSARSDVSSFDELGSIWANSNGIVTQYGLTAGKYYWLNLNYMT